MDYVQLDFRGGAKAVRTLVRAEGLEIERLDFAGSAAFDYSRAAGRPCVARHDVLLRAGAMTLRDESSADRDLRGRITFIPAGETINGWALPTDRPQSLVAIHFDTASIPLALIGAFDWERSILRVRNGALAETLSKLGEAMTLCGHAARLACERSAKLAIVELALGEPAGPPIRSGRTLH